MKRKNSRLEMIQGPHFNYDLKRSSTEDIRFCINSEELNCGNDVLISFLLTKGNVEERYMTD